jgi:hypothetical protein
VTYWLSVRDQKFKGANVSIHADPRCHELLKRRLGDGDRPVVLTAVPDEYVRFLNPCSRCVRLRWIAKEPRPPEMAGWYGRARGEAYRAAGLEPA